MCLQSSLLFAGVAPKFATNVQAHSTSTLLQYSIISYQMQLPEIRGSCNALEYGAVARIETVCKNC